MGRTQMGRTHERTDGQGGDYMLPRNISGSIKIVTLYVLFLVSMATVILNAPCVVSNAESFKFLYKQALYQWFPWFTGNHSNWFQLLVKLR